VAACRCMWTLALGPLLPVRSFTDTCIARQCSLQSSLSASVRSRASPHGWGLHAFVVFRGESTNSEGTCATGEFGTTLVQSGDLQWIHDFSEWVNNISPANDGQHSPVTSYFYWCACTKSGSMHVCLTKTSQRQSCIWERLSIRNEKEIIGT
jgi:hypothetical protein